MKFPNSKSDQYYKVVAGKTDWLGIRFFRFNPNCDHTVQAVLFEGDVKKGRSNSFGVYLISRVTFLTNYMAMGYVQPCLKAEYNRSFDKIIGFLK